MNEQSGAHDAGLTDQGARSQESMTIDQIAAVTGIPGRTIRYYQSRGALMPPEIRGRVAYYSEQHVERLELISQLKDRGLRIRAIAELVNRIDAGGYDLGEWLGIEETLQAAWVDDSPQTISDGALHRMLGDEGRPGLRDELERALLVQRVGERWRITSPGLLQVTLRLEAAGIRLPLAVGAFMIMQTHMRSAAGELASYFNEHSGEAFGSEPTAERLERVFAALRPAALATVRLVFAREMESRLREMVREGEVPRAPRSAG
ncbi:MAG: MerR family transcriptional regulator [Myxococcales bacterium]|nr:MerR family transcriptional regulator [Myxococcales bacterium]MCB9749801.1 MerR family transcriptional regulator [Myxococcales bacterium]